MFVSHKHKKSFGIAPVGLAPVLHRAQSWRKTVHCADLTHFFLRRNSYFLRQNKKFSPLFLELSAHGRRAGGNGCGCGHKTSPNSRDGGFLFFPLFFGLPSLRGDVLFGGPFLSRQDVLSSPMSPTSDAAALDVGVPLPFALSGTSPSLRT